MISGTLQTLHVREKQRRKTIVNYSLTIRHTIVNISQALVKHS